MSKSKLSVFCIIVPISIAILSLVLSLVSLGCTLTYIESSPFNIPSRIMIWTSGLLIWFFGLYSFIEKEIKGAYKRLLLLKSLENEEDIHEKKSLAILRPPHYPRLRAIRKLVSRTSFKDHHAYHSVNHGSSIFRRLFGSGWPL